jgi:nicotinamide mononucleotide transporter
MSILEIIGFITGILGVYLTSRQSLWCWPVSIFNVLLYAYIFFNVQLYADSALQIYFLVLCVYGWWQWTKKQADGTLLKVSKASGIILTIGGICIALLGIGSYYVLYHFTDAAFPFWDSVCFAGSIFAQYLQSRKYIENWLVWIGVDIIYVSLYLQRDLNLTAVLYLIFLGIALFGYWEWRKSLKLQS